MKENTKDTLLINTRVSKKASDKIEEYQSNHKLKTGVKITKMQALNLMLENYKLNKN